METATDTTRPVRSPRRAVPRGSYLVAIILAVGICTALNMLTFGILYDAIFSESSGISENATQILTGWGGGVVGVIGAVVGYQAGQSASDSRRDTDR